MFLGTVFSVPGAQHEKPVYGDRCVSSSHGWDICICATSVQLLKINFSCVRIIVLLTWIFVTHLHCVAHGEGIADFQKEGWTQVLGGCTEWTAEVITRCDIVGDS